jgi:Heavy metal binding domain
MLSPTVMYSCPMHSDIRQPTAGKCTKCGMDLVAESARFRLLRHMTSSPLHIAIMAALMLAAMAAAMMMTMRGTGP